MKRLIAKPSGRIIQNETWGRLIGLFYTISANADNVYTALNSRVMEYPPSKADMKRAFSSSIAGIPKTSYTVDPNITYCFGKVNTVSLEGNKGLYGSALLTGLCDDIFLVDEKQNYGYRLTDMNDFIRGGSNRYTMPNVCKLSPQGKEVAWGEDLRAFTTSPHLDKIEIATSVCDNAINKCSEFANIFIEAEKFFENNEVALNHLIKTKNEKLQDYYDSLKGIVDILDKEGNLQSSTTGIKCFRIISNAKDIELELKDMCDDFADEVETLKDQYAQPQAQAKEEEEEEDYSYIRGLK